MFSSIDVTSRTINCEREVNVSKWGRISRSANGRFGEATWRAANGARGRLVRSDLRLPDEARQGPAGVELCHLGWLAGRLVCCKKRPESNLRPATRRDASLHATAPRPPLVANTRPPRASSRIRLDLPRGRHASSSGRTARMFRRTGAPPPCGRDDPRPLPVRPCLLDASRARRGCAAQEG